MKIWAEAAEHISEAPDWFFDGYVWPELNRRKQGDTPAARRKRQEKKEADSKARIAAECKQGWEDAEGCLAYPYEASEDWILPMFKWGTIRIPDSGRYMYVRVPVRRTELPDRVAATVIDGYAYWRHQRFTPHWEYPSTKYYEARKRRFYGFKQGTMYRSHKAKHEVDEGLFGKRYSVQECKRELQKHHPDKGGDPDTAALWTRRLTEARRVRA